MSNLYAHRKFIIRKLWSGWHHWVPGGYGATGWHKSTSFKSALSDVLAKAGPR